MISKLKLMTNNKQYVVNCAIAISCIIPFLYIIYLSMSAQGMHSSISTVFETYPKEALNVIRMSLMPFCAYVIFSIKDRSDANITPIFMMLAVSQLLSLNFPLAIVLAYYLINFSSTSGIKNHIVEFKELRLDRISIITISILMFSILLAVVQVKALL